MYKPELLHQSPVKQQHYQCCYFWWSPKRNQFRLFAGRE